ncbi:hypothetical protein Asp14428_12940 [Actinoplanes sp. NBRC 14428]|nr:hypothetical protein Asp14428_12940 [Actinoplanes sp. NBRC 14428]
MKRNGPMLTLLAGIGVAAVLFLLSLQATRNADAALTAPAAVASAPEPRVKAGVVAVPDGGRASSPPVARVPAAGTPTTADGQPLAQQPTPDGSYAGRLTAGTLALTIKEGKAIAYVCDGRRTEAWLKGTARDGRFDLSGKNGATLTGTADKRHATGRITLNGRTSDVDIATVRKPSGLYRATADVRGAKLVGGWIVLEDGSQVGLATIGGRPATPSRVDVTTGRATVDGTPVTATPADPAR